MLTQKAIATVPREYATDTLLYRQSDILSEDEKINQIEYHFAHIMRTLGLDERS